MKQKIFTLPLLFLLVILTACQASLPAASLPATNAPRASIATTPAASTATTSGFTLTSPDLPADGRLPVEYTCDGSGEAGTASTLALAWNGAPAETQSFAVIAPHRQSR